MKNQIKSYFKVFIFLSILLSVGLFSNIGVTTAFAGYGSGGYKNEPPKGSAIDSSFKLTGYASIDTSYPNTVILTPDTTYRYGSLWSTKKVNLKEPFKAVAYLHLGHADGKSGTTADGIAFVMHNDSRGYNTNVANSAIERSGGAAINIYGSSYIQKSMAIEFDTYYNTDSYWASTDPVKSAYNSHCAFTFPKTTRITSSEHLNTQWFNYSTSWLQLRVEWTPQTKGSTLGGTISYYFEGTGTTSSYTISNVSSVFGGTEVWWGFTGATGSYSALNSVAIAEFPGSNYTVTFNTNGGSPVPNSQSIPSGAKVAKPIDVLKEGYVFAGWYSTSNFSGNAWNFDVNTVTGNMTLYAKWVPATYTVVFEANGGSPVPNSQSIQSGGKVAKPIDVSKEGYVFAGWYPISNFSGNAWNFDVNTVTGNMTLYAKWVPATYTVVFEANGGSPVPVSQTLMLGSLVTKPDDPILSGNTFAGWYLASDFTGNEWDFNNNAVICDIVLYAKWIPVPQVVITGTAVNILENSATIIDNTYSGITGTINFVAIQYSTNTSMSSSKIAYGTIGSPYSVDLTELQPDTIYYYRAGVNTSSGSAFGEIKSFKTPAQKPAVITGDAVNILANSAAIANNTYTGITGNISFVAVQYSTSQTMASPATVYGTIGSPYSVNLTGLQPNTTYYYRAGVNASSGSAFGAIKSFTTPQIQLITYYIYYYDGSIASENLINRSAARQTPYGTVITLSDADLDAFIPDSGYNKGVQVGGPVAITVNGQVINVLYETPAVRIVTINHYLETGYKTNAFSLGSTSTAYLVDGSTVDSSTLIRTEYLRNYTFYIANPATFVVSSSNNVIKIYYLRNQGN